MLSGSYNSSPYATYVKMCVSANVYYTKVTVCVSYGMYDTEVTVCVSYGMYDTKVTEMSVEWQLQFIAPRIASDNVCK